MPKIKKKLLNAQKRAKKDVKAERQKKYMWVFMSGKQVRVKRPQTIDGMDADEFILQNADPICLHQNEIWEENFTPEKYKSKKKLLAQNNSIKLTGTVAKNRDQTGIIRQTGWATFSAHQTVEL